MTKIFIIDNHYETTIFTYQSEVIALRPWCPSEINHSLDICGLTECLGEFSVRCRADGRRGDD